MSPHIYHISYISTFIVRLSLEGLVNACAAAAQQTDDAVDEFPNSI